MRFVTAALTLAIAGSVLLAGPKTRKDYKDLAKETRKSGKLALIVFGADKTLREWITKDDQAGAILVKYVEVSFIDSAAGGPTLEELKKKVESRDGRYWAITTPELVLLDGGDVRSMERGRDDWLKRVAALSGKYPPLPEDRRKKLEETLAEARKDFDEHRYGDAAAKTTDTLKVLWFPRSSIDPANALLTAIEQRGQMALAEAESLTEREPLEAAKAYDKIVSQFSANLPAGRKAQEQMRIVLGRNPEALQQFRQWQRDVRAEEIVAQATAEEGKNNRNTALGLYTNVLRHYADTPSAAIAAEATQRINPGYRLPATTSAPADPASQPATAQSQSAAQSQPAGDDDAAAKAEAAVKLAQTYRSAGMKQRANERLLDVLREYPDTPAAQEAKQLLAEWAGD